MVLTDRKAWLGQQATNIRYGIQLHTQLVVSDILLETDGLAALQGAGQSLPPQQQQRTLGVEQYPAL